MNGGGDGWTIPAFAMVVHAAVLVILAIEGRWDVFFLALVIGAVVVWCLTVWDESRYGP